MQERVMVGVNDKIDCPSYLYIYILDAIYPSTNPSLLGRQQGPVLPFHACVCQTPSTSRYGVWVPSLSLADMYLPLPLNIRHCYLSVALAASGTVTTTDLRRL